ncbi:hypothetical protein DL93DRAFT_397598 [Clavulina sp. PMI_390]|nr:hypothetical protein DL93DRAFT_397598 [Clavulina sp. PMI_390]
MLAAWPGRDAGGTKLSWLLAPSCCWADIASMFGGACRAPGPPAAVCGPALTPDAAPPRRCCSICCWFGWPCCAKRELLYICWNCCC